MVNRCERFKQLLAENGIGAAFITRPEHMRYLSGYTGEGALFVAQDAAVIITDFRYIEQAERQSPDWTIAQTTIDNKAPAIVLSLLNARAINKLHFEADVMTVSEYEGLRDELSGIEFISIPNIIATMRKVKDQHEIDCIIAAGKIACAAFEELLTFVKPGMTERQIQQHLDFTMLQMGSEQNAFDTIAAAGPNGSLPHATPSDRPVQVGELLTLDFGAQVDGYKCDMTRTIAFGEISDELKAIYDAVYEAQRLAYEGIKPGANCKAIDAIARDYLEGLYPGAFGHSLGHGVGLQIHETPNFSMRCEEDLLPGHVMTVEPGVYIKGLGGCRIEDMAIITKDGYINPITVPRTLTTV